MFSKALSPILFFTIPCLSWAVSGTLTGEYGDLSITGNTTLNGEVWTTGLVTINGEGTMTGSAENGDAFFTKDVIDLDTSEDAEIVLYAKANYTIDAPIYFSGLSVGGNLWYGIHVSNGKTLKLSNLNFLTPNNKGRQGMQFLSDRTNDSSKFAHIYLAPDSDSTLNSDKRCEHWLRYVNIHATTGVNYGDLHFQYGSHFTLETENVSFRYIRVRQSYYSAKGPRVENADLRNYTTGKLFMNGYSAKINELHWNPSSGGTTHQLAKPTDFYIDFGENNKAQYCYIGALSEHGASATAFQNNWDYDRLFITNMGINDMIVLGKDPFTSLIGDGTAKAYMIDVLSRILDINGDFVNGNVEYLKSITKQLTADDTDDTALVGKWAIMLIPEPAEYAAMFGALALAFAIYRRKK